MRISDWSSDVCSSDLFVMTGTGSKQEDQIITVGLEQATGAQFKYIPQKGGGDVAKAVVGNHANSSVNNPVEQIPFWKADRKSVVEGKRVSVSVDLGGRRIIKKKTRPQAPQRIK